MFLCLTMTNGAMCAAIRAAHGWFTAARQAKTSAQFADGVTPSGFLGKNGKIRYRGYCVFPDHADYGALLRPLIDFGCKHGCYQIAYKVGKRYNKIPLELAFRFSRLCCVSASTREFLDFYDLHDLSEADAGQLENYIDYVTEV